MRKTVSPVFCAGQREEGRKSLNTEFTKRRGTEHAEKSKAKMRVKSGRETFNTEFTERRATEHTEKSKEELGGAMWSTSSAEVQKKYFGSMKFATQVLKTLCKRGLAAELTRHSSTP